MALSDWRHRRSERPTDYDRPHGYVPSWGIILTVIVLVMLLWALFGAFNSWNERAVTNAPADTPPSTQQPDTTPPDIPKPAQ